MLVAVLRAPSASAMPPRRPSWGRLGRRSASCSLGFGNGGTGLGGADDSERVRGARSSAMTPFWMVGIDSLMPGSRAISTRRAQIVGLVVGFAGVLMLVWPEMPRPAAARRHSCKALIAAEIACVGLGAAVRATRRRRRPERERASSWPAFEMIFGGLFLRRRRRRCRQEWRTVAFTTRDARRVALPGVSSAAIAGFSAYAVRAQAPAGVHRVAVRRT